MGDLTDNFNRHEFACKCKCGFDTVDVELIEVLEDLRELYNQPVTINSACRCDKHNKKVGGRPGSKHRLGIAADIVVRNVSPHDVYKCLKNTYQDKYGIGKYDSFTHIDVRPNKARW